MIPVVRGWHRVDDAGGVKLFHPDGPEAGAIRYRETVRPLARMSTIVEELTARGPAIAGFAWSAIERGLTDEGEHTALVVGRGLLEGRAILRLCGAVFGDDSYSLLTAVSLVQEVWDQVESTVRFLLEKDAHGRGLRRRRFVYRPPAGWQGLARGFTTEWQPPGFPGDATLIQVLPAHPVADPPRAVLLQSLADDTAEGLEILAVDDEQEVCTAAGLRGSAWLVRLKLADGAALRRLLVALRDPRHLYAVRAETTREEIGDLLETVEALVESIEPVPAGGMASVRLGTALAAQWAD